MSDGRATVPSGGGPRGGGAGSVELDVHRLWQLWQQMHYPRRGLPQVGSVAAELLAIDGRAGAALDLVFRGGRRGRPMDGGCRAALEDCRRQLDEVAGGLTHDAARYFGRLRALLEEVLVPAADSSTRPSRTTTTLQGVTSGQRPPP